MKIIRNKYFNIVWTVLRVWLGYQWISAGWEKITSPAWTGSKVPSGINGFLQGAVAKSIGAKPVVQPWYGSFIKNFALPHAKIFSYLVASGEFLVGISLIFGALTLVGLLVGAFMNLNYMLAGTISTNPNDYTVAMILLFAGAGVYKIGVDYYLLPLLKKLFKKDSNIANVIE